MSTTYLGWPTVRFEGPSARQSAVEHLGKDEVIRSITTTVEGWLEIRTAGAKCIGFHFPVKVMVIHG